MLSISIQGKYGNPNNKTHNLFNHWTHTPMTTKELHILNKVMAALRRNFPGVRFRLQRQSHLFYYISMDKLSLMNTVQFTKKASLIKLLYKKQLKKHIILCYYNSSGNEGFN